QGNECSLRVRGKGRKEWIVSLNYKICRVLKAYLAIRTKVDEATLFLTNVREAPGHALDSEYRQRIPHRGRHPGGLDPCLAPYLRRPLHAQRHQARRGAPGARPRIIGHHECLRGTGAGSDGSGVAARRTLKGG